MVHRGEGDGVVNILVEVEGIALNQRVEYLPRGNQSAWDLK